MDSSIATRFGAVEIAGTLRVLARSERARACLKEAMGDERGDAAVEMLEGGRLDGELGADIENFLVDEIQNEAQVVWRGITFDPDDEDNVDRQFLIQVMAYEGVFFVWALEEEPQGYFLSEKQAAAFLSFNWPYVRQDRA